MTGAHHIKLKAGAWRTGSRQHLCAGAAWIAPSLLSLAGLFAVAWVSLCPRPGQPVAAVFPPWWSVPRAFGSAAAAGGVIIRVGAWSGIVVTRSTVPGFAARLHAAGAWFVLDPLVGGGCVSPTRRIP